MLHFFILCLTYVANHFLPGLFKRMESYYTAINDVPSFKFACSLVPLVVGLVWLTAVYIKKKRQVGQLWSGSYTYGVVDYPHGTLDCPLCKNNKFFKHEGLLASSFVRLFKFGQFNQSCCCFVCTECSYIRWFTKKEVAFQIQRTPATASPVPIV